MTRSQHPSVGMRAVPNPDDAPNPEQVARIRDAHHLLDMLLDTGINAPVFTMHMSFNYVTDKDGVYTLAPESRRIYEMADHVDVVDKHVRHDGALSYVALELWYGEFSVRALCHAPEVLGDWTPPDTTGGTFTLHQRERLPFWAE